ncbi:MAG TPA: hypothetical protein PKK06_11460 [Phycisphaerae bacterium]|nr:hypothetical protein [Phycisphaerae bacterium]HNU45858.1 hypothetical protein [Phycisphaerae bacterium]
MAIDSGAASTTNYVTAQNGGFLACTLIGRYLEVRVQLNAAEHNSVWPTLQSLTASGCLVLPQNYVDECDDEEQGNGIPDHCEPDCNDNGWPDWCGSGLAGRGEVLFNVLTSHQVSV